MPYGVVARQNGRLYCYTRGSLVWDRVKVLIRHDNSQIVGSVVELTETDEGLFVRLALSRRALALVEVYTGLSVGRPADARYDLRDGIYYPSGRLVEVSLTPEPLFDTARIGAP